MFWSEIWLQFCVAFCATFFATIFSWMTIRLFDIISKQREFVSILIAFKNECRSNLSGRGNSQSPFRSYWLEKALNNLNFYEQCGDIAIKSLEVFELAQDANIDQLACRKHSNGVSMVPLTVQDKILEIADGIDSVIPELQKRARVRYYFLWRFKSNRSYLVNIWLNLKRRMQNSDCA